MIWYGGCLMVTLRNQVYLLPSFCRTCGASHITKLMYITNRTKLKIYIHTGWSLLFLFPSIHILFWLQSLFLCGWTPSLMQKEKFSVTGCLKIARPVMRIFLVEGYLCWGLFVLRVIFIEDEAIFSQNGRICNSKDWVAPWICHMTKKENRSEK